MAEPFLQLPPEEQAEILQTCAGKLGRRAEHLEKDVWICWVLQGLFTTSTEDKGIVPGKASLRQLLVGTARGSGSI